MWSHLTQVNIYNNAGVVNYKLASYLISQYEERQEDDGRFVGLCLVGNIM